MLAPFHYAFVQRGRARDAAALGRRRAARHLDRPARPRLLLARRRQRRRSRGSCSPTASASRPPARRARGAALLFAVGVERLAAARRSGYDSLTALVLVGALALGVILASDVFHSGPNVETLLFGSLLADRRARPRLRGRCERRGPRRRARARAGAGSRPASTRSRARARAALGAARRRPARCSSRSASSSALAAIGALLATALFVVPAATVRLLTRRLRPGSSRSVVLAAVEGVVGLWLSVEMNVPPGRGDRRAGRRRLRARRAGARGRARGAAPRRSLAAVLPSALLLAAPAAARASGSASRRRHDDPDRRLGRAVGGPDARRPPDPAAEHRSARVRAAPARRPGHRGRQASCFESGDGLDAWMGKRRRRRPAASPTVVVLGDGARQAARASDGPELAYDPHWWHDPRNAEAAVRDDRRRARCAPTRRTRAATSGDARRVPCASCARSTAGIARVLREGAARASASSSPTTTRSATSPHRYGIQVVGAVIPSQTTQAQPSAGRDRAT